MESLDPIPAVAYGIPDTGGVRHADVTLRAGEVLRVGASGTDPAGNPVVLEAHGWEARTNPMRLDAEVSERRRIAMNGTRWGPLAAAFGAIRSWHNLGHFCRYLLSPDNACQVSVVAGAPGDADQVWLQIAVRHDFPADRLRSNPVECRNRIIDRMIDQLRELRAYQPHE